MKLNKQQLGSLIEICNKTCDKSNLSAKDVSGINREKLFFEPTLQIGRDTSKYKIVPPGYFACNLMHIGRDKVLPIALNTTGKNKIVSPVYIVFCVKNESLILSEYLYILLNSKEKDRYFWFKSDSSICDVIEWKTFCELELFIPPIKIQKKYVDMYKELQNITDLITKEIEQLKLVIKNIIEKLTKTNPKEEIGKYIEEEKISNENLKYTSNDIRGISIDKKFIKNRVAIKKADLKKYKIVKPKTLSYIPVTSRNSDKISFAYNDTQNTYIVSHVYKVFKVKEINPQYLYVILKSEDFDRYARFKSRGSAREVIDFSDICGYKIPVCNIEEQKNVTELYELIERKKELVERIKKIQKKICPLLCINS